MSSPSSPPATTPSTDVHHDRIVSQTRVVSARRSMATRLGDLWRYRELLVGLVRKELKVKYKDSVLGFVWSMLNPALYLVVFYVAFQLVLGNNIPRFAIFLLSGLLVWNLFSTALSAATGSIVANSAIVKKVAFPREILPLATVGASLVHFFLQSLVLLGALVIVRQAPSLEFSVLLIPALLVLLLLAGAMGILLAAINVYLRDAQHLLELVLLAWFWATPIVYPFRQVAEKLDKHGLTWVYLLNPVTPIVLSFQRAVYNAVEPLGKGNVPVKVLSPEPLSWYLMHLGIVAAVSLVILYVALAFFGRAEGNFAEEL